MAASAEAMDLAGLTVMAEATAMAAALAVTVIARGTPAESSSEVGDILILGATPITMGILLIIHRRIMGPGLTLAIRAPARTEARLSVAGRIERGRVVARDSKKTCG